MNQQTTKPVSESNKSTRKALLEALVKKNEVDGTSFCYGVDICLTSTDKI